MTFTHTGTPTSTAVIGVDVGGTDVKGAVFSPSGQIIAQTSRPTFSIDGLPRCSLHSVVVELQASSCALGVPVGEIGVSTAGLVDSRTGIVTSAANLGWTDEPLGSLLEQRTGLPVTLDHDARAAARAEQMVRRGQDGFDNFVFIPIGTGVAAGIIMDGHLITGATGAAGEFGHVPVEPGGRLCACGQRGCLEAYSSGSSIVARYRELGGTAARSSADVVRLQGHDPIAQEAWDTAITALSIALTALIAITDPRTVVIGGGLSRAGAALIDPLRVALACRLRWRPTPRIEQSELSSYAGLIGAGLLALHHPVPDSFVATALDELRAVSSGRKAS